MEAARIELLQMRSMEADNEMKELIDDDIRVINEQLIEREPELCDEFDLAINGPQNSGVLELRPAVGGVEASIFAAELFEMYRKIASRHHWKFHASDSQPGGTLWASIEGASCVKLLKTEAGVHCVKRVPVTETGGRVHTSTVTVAVLPQPEPDSGFKLNEKEFHVEFKTSTGSGGQHANKTESAVRLKHLPSGTAVTIQDERSKHLNLARAWKIIRAKIYAAHINKLAHERSKERALMVGTGDFGSKIRSYTYQQNRVTDHRIHQSYSLRDFMDGECFDDLSRVLVQHRLERQLDTWLDSILDRNNKH